MAYSATAIINEAADKINLTRILNSAGFKTKENPVKKRITVVSDKRGETVKDIISLLKNNGKNVELDKSRTATNISSMGFIVVDSNLQIVVKPETKNVMAAEEEATKDLIRLINDANEQYGGPITIMIGKYKIEKVVTAGSNHIRNDPKADIALMDNSGNEVGFISHKKAGGAKAFQQYGGISKKAGEVIYRNNMVVNYVKTLDGYVDNSTAKKGQSFYRYIPNTPAGKKLVGQSVYGPRFDSGKSFNRDSVHCIGQGDPILTKKSEGVYVLTFSDSIHTADQIDWAFRGLFKAVFASTFRNRRKTEALGISVMNLRSGIYPYDFVAGRKATEI
jgi:hypothetical protein